MSMMIDNQAAIRLNVLLYQKPSTDNSPSGRQLMNCLSEAHRHKGKKICDQARRGIIVPKKASSDKMIASILTKAIKSHNIASLQAHVSFK